MKEEILRMEHVYVKHLGKYILKDFKLNVYKGEMIIVFGLPGSGISELGKVLSGEDEIEKGRILFEEEIIDMKHKFYPEKYGIHSVFNEDNLIPDLTISDNLFFGWQKNIFSFTVRKKKRDHLAKMVFEEFQIHMDLNQKAKHLTYFQQIIVKFIKAYVKGAKLLIVNDIMVSAYGKQRHELVRVLNKLRDDGISIIWMNQRIGFVKEMAERIIVLRNGCNVKTFYGSKYTMELLVKTATDTQVPEPVRLHGKGQKEPFLKLENVTAGRIRNLSLSIGKGSIVGIWANDSVYLKDIFQLLCGECQKESGQMWLDNKIYNPSDYYKAVKRGVEQIDCMLHEKHLLPEMSIVDNMMMKNYWMASGKSLFINQKRNRYKEFQYKELFGMGEGEKLKTLTEDQQRILILERCLESPGKLIAIIEPFSKMNYLTVVNINQIFQRILDEGKTLLIFSINYQDLREICEEVVLIGDGMLIDHVPREKMEDMSIEGFFD